MYESFGARQAGKDSDKGKVEFKLFIPDNTISPDQYSGVCDPKIKEIRVVGTFQERLKQTNWDKVSAPVMTREKHPNGWLWSYTTDVDLPEGFYEYKYYVTFQDASVKPRWCTDPCTRYGGSADQNSAFVVGGSFPGVGPLLGGRQPHRDLVVYELNIDDFTAEYRGGRAPIEAVTEKVSYIKDLGINAILFMPWTAWPGYGYSWGYTPYQYFAVEYRYANAIGKPSEKLSLLKTLISECHKSEIHVIMDGVYNHSADDANKFPYVDFYQDRDKCPYVGQYGGSFPGLTDLNYNNDCTQEFIRDVCFYWMDEFKIDGIRFDNTTNYYIKGSNRGLHQLLEDITNHVSDKGEYNFSLTLEHIDMSAAQVTKDTKATSYWDNSLYGNTFDNLWNWSINQKLMMSLNANKWLLDSNGKNADNKVATTYLTNHDHSHVAWQAGARDNQGAMQWYRTQPYVIAMMTMPGVPMILNGQEFAEDAWVMEDDKGSGRRVIPRPLRWEFSSDKIGKSLSDLYRKLIKIRRGHRALQTDHFYPDWEDWMRKPNQEGYGIDVDRQIVIFHRWGDNPYGKRYGQIERFIIVLNFSQNDQDVSVPFSVNGQWIDILAEPNYTINVDGFRSNVRVDSNWGCIFYIISKEG
ncbi:alpha-amylase family glycosyl hydrolase [Candidatus Magnetominusculus xianensis]|uniref:1,4-alpha-glucan-branching protein n=1 Tax=Candidatus Magnetominusculus xianensis TaxID=1748249 RepID=A0ABR5SIN4_9BACT|nr:alpha-amylase family glycosyl hydrolase [Candidatus Magnetominusculus xianensis]KWT92781.1 1,4-alpha-glucan-branching protein [Candidatus Magnetominusculus xianensis]MBF0405235.1 alpha-amylase [Nitrospirota bacterium]